MSAVDFLLELYCLVDEELRHVMPPRGPRQHGPAPTLADAEVVTMELAGEFWGHDRDKHLFEFFRRYHAAEFPALARVGRTTFVRQAANLWEVKARLWRRLVGALPAGLCDWWCFDSFPLYVCSFARAPRCRLFAGLAAFGYDHVQHRVFYGFKWHLRCGLGGPIGAVEVAPANVPDAALVPELVPEGGGVGLGDRAYWDPLVREQVRAQGLELIAPFRRRSGDPLPALSRAVSRLRQGVETVIAQLAERFNGKWTWARDRWHLTHRVIRKVLAHTACVWLNLRHGNPPLQLDRLVD